MSLRKKYFVTAMVFSVALIVATGFFSKQMLQFSHPSGFYDTEFDLEISGALGCSIYYTLDGSTPTRDSVLYTGPIHISDASELPNRYANIRETTHYVFPEVYAQFGYPPRQKFTRQIII